MTWVVFALLVVQARFVVRSLRGRGQRCWLCWMKGARHSIGGDPVLDVPCHAVCGARYMERNPRADLVLTVIV